jgi:hypothetical protein
MTCEAGPGTSQQLAVRPRCALVEHALS